MTTSSSTPQPELELYPDRLELQITQPGDILRTTVRIINREPDAPLEQQGVYWAVLPHASDSQINPKTSGKTSSDRHAWIAWTPRQIQDNPTDCQIQINTKRLKLNQIYQRQLVLRDRTGQILKTLPLSVLTRLPALPKIPYISLIVLFSIAIGAGNLSGHIIQAIDLKDTLIFTLGTLLGIAGGIAASHAGAAQLKRVAGLVVSLSGILGFVSLTSDLELSGGFLLSLIVVSIAGIVRKNHLERKFSQRLAILSPTLTVIGGCLWGVGVGMHSGIWVGLAICSAIVPLGWLLLQPHLERQQIINRYQNQRQNHIAT